jgi:hypothetical protein
VELTSRQRGPLARVTATGAVLRALGARTFVGAERSNRVGLVVECPDMDTFQRALQSDDAADAMRFDGVRPETIVVLAES